MSGLAEHMGEIVRQNELMKAALLVIAGRPTHEGGCYYNNRHSISEARDTLKKCGIDWLAARGGQ